MRLFEDDQYWESISDGDLQAFEIFKKHYTFKARKNGKNCKRFAGPGERIILIGKDRKALFVWRKERFRMDEQTGVNNAVFRRETGAALIASQMILEAEAIARARWPGERLYTFVNKKKVKSENPGYCYKMAGWKLAGITKKRKHLIFEKV